MDERFANKYAELEENHWWFKGRREILQTLLQKHLNWDSVEQLLEVGVSSGVNLYSLYPLAQNKLFGVEPFEPNRKIADSRGDIDVYAGTAETLPEEIQSRQFDVITMFDVLEHTEGDVFVLETRRNKLSDDGKLILTVPAYNFLWGEQDIVSHHYRRYTKGMLENHLHSAGYRVSYASYFNTFLFPPIVLFRLIDRLKTKEEYDEFGNFRIGNPLMDKWLYRIFRNEKNWLKYLRFPFGISLFTIATPKW